MPRSRPVGPEHGGSSKIAVLDFRPATRGVGMNEKPNTHPERARNGNLGGMQQRHDVPAEFLGGSSGKRGIEIVGDGKQTAYDVVGIKPVGFDQGAEQLVGGGENFCRIVPGNCRSSTDPMEPD